METTLSTTTSNQLHNGQKILEQILVAIQEGNKINEIERAKTNQQIGVLSNDMTMVKEEITDLKDKAEIDYDQVQEIQNQVARIVYTVIPEKAGRRICNNAFKLAYRQLRAGTHFRTPMAKIQKQHYQEIVEKIPNIRFSLQDVMREIKKIDEKNAAEAELIKHMAISSY